MINRKEAVDQFKEYVTYDVETISKWDPNPWESDEYEVMLTNLMMHLEKAGGVEFAVLKDHKLGKWWAKKSKEIERERQRLAALAKLKATMSPAELEILRIKL